MLLNAQMQKFLRPINEAKFLGEQMNLQERLAECQKIKADVEKEEQELLKQIEKERELEFGDIVFFKSDAQRKRIVLYDKTGKLCTFDCDGDRTGWTNINDGYRKTGQNLFKNNLVNLSD